MFVFLQAFEEGTTTASLDRMTISDNVSANHAGGIHVETFIDFDDPPSSSASGRLDVWNSIISGNTGWGIGGPIPGREGGVRAPGSGTGNLTVDVRYSDVWDHSSAPFRKWIGDPHRKSRQHDDRSDVRRRLDPPALFSDDRRRRARAGF